MSSSYADFKWPSPAEQLQGTVQGIDSVLPVASVPIRSNGILSPPVATVVGGMAGALQDATSVPFGDLVNLSFQSLQALNAKNPVQALEAVAGLFNSAVDIAIEISSAVEIASDVAEVVPIVGGVVRLALSLISGVFQTYQERDLRTEECRRNAAQQHDVFCQSLVNMAKPERSDINHLPSDLFRLLAYNEQKGVPLVPPNASALYVALCGGQAGDMSVVTDAEYYGICKGAGVEGTPPETRQRMWTLIRGLMKNVQRTDIGVAPSLDSGRSLMPILQDIVRNEYMKGLRVASRKGINRQVLSALAYRCISKNNWTRAQYPCKGANVNLVYEDCVSRIHPVLTDMFEEAIWTFDRQMLKIKMKSPSYKEPMNVSSALNPAIADSLSRAGFTKVIPSSNSPQGVLTLSESSQKMIEQIQAGQAYHESSARWWWAVVLGSGAFVGARKLAKRSS